VEIAKHVDQIVLFSGDGDFRSLVEAVQRRGVHVTVISTIASQPPMIAGELRRQADVFIDLAGLRAKIGRVSPERPTASVPTSERLSKPAAGATTGIPLGGPQVRVASKT
jgi:uncharacterized LabA/DUF88 family protein